MRWANAIDSERSFAPELPAVDDGRDTGTRAGVQV
jgi:hypothetical protein